MKIFYTILFFLSVAGLVVTNFVFLSVLHHYNKLWPVIISILAILASIVLLFLTLGRLLKLPQPGNKKKSN